MYYILNQAGQIVAVDPQLLAQLNTSNVDELYKKISLGEITVTLEEDKVTLTENGSGTTFTAAKSPLTGILGELILVVIDADTAAPTDIILEETSEGLQEEQVSLQEASQDESLSLDDDLLFELKEPTTEKEAADELQFEEHSQSSSGDVDDELFDLIIPTDADNAISNIEEEKHATEQTEESTPIYIDIDTVSRKIGISTDDYNLFLDEYIDTALTLEEALKSDQTEEQQEALHKLAHLSNVLHLPYVDELLKQIEEAPEEKRNDRIASFFATLGRLTTTRFEEGKKTETGESETAPKEVSDSAKPRTPIDLSDVKPVHFDFQIKEAADDLSLPVELIEEFVNDFIAQAHEETDKMLKAYEQGDLETIQKIGHLLKGTASNLRIEPLAETLYEIQFNEDLDKVPELVKNYWGHFLSFENQIKLISTK